MSIAKDPTVYAQELLDLGFTYADYKEQYGHYTGYSELVRKAMLELGDTTAATLAEHLATGYVYPLMAVAKDILGLSEDDAFMVASLTERACRGKLGLSDDEIIQELHDIELMYQNLMNK